MAGIFKALSKAVEDGGERVGLDKLVENLSNRFTESLKLVEKNQHSKAEVNKLIDKVNTDYDRRAEKQANRSVPADWNEHNKDLLAVRKRMLNRNIQASSKTFFEEIENQMLLDSVLQDAHLSQQGFMITITDVLPMSRTNLEATVLRNKLQILEKARSQMPTIDTEPLRRRADPAGRTWAQFCDSVLPAAEAAMNKANEDKIKAAIAERSIATNIKLRQALEAVLSAADAEFSVNLNAMLYLDDAERDALMREYSMTTAQFRAV